MKYKCLVLDHDDTAVKSTPELHYPAFCEIMEILRPDHEGYSLAQFAHLCSDPGFETFCRNALAFTDEDISATRHPHFTMDFWIWYGNSSGEVAMYA